ncbi:hypothetical protein [Cylindrospermopsis raciborskii]|uniref:hypothetical protein n=1 Tax=Cylindrospermopsis raciborskii TaxID=77022 RepID=UPI001FC90F55|nr:hypothetical protein [Cylindrospermopsis raciborskii]
MILIAHRLSTLENAIAFFSWIRDRFVKKAIGDSPTNSATGGVVGATGGTDPAIVSTSIRSTG